MDQKVLAANVIEIKSGEINKNLESCKRIWEQLIKAGADRHSILINLGGGVIGDMGGFCASTYMRGIRFIQVPTTLLAQVDASVGGKLGIDYLNLKNIIGQFNDPLQVFADPVFFKTLPKRQLKSAYAEIFKHALIKDAEHWKQVSKIDTLEETNSWSQIIYHSINIKKEVVEADPFEKGERKILNFGHTIGHAVESFYLNSKQAYLHGEAIGIGMICEAYLSHQKNDLSEAALNEIIESLFDVYDLRKVPTRYLDDIIALMSKDKKNKDGALMFSLLSQIGTCTYNVSCDPNEILSSLQYYNDVLSQ